AGHAAAGAALKMNLRDQHPTDDQIDETQKGMLLDSTLQAILRGNARMAVAGDCGAMEVVIPQTKQTGLSDKEYQRIFPKCKLVNDTVLMPLKELKGNLKRLADRVMKLRENGLTEIPNSLIYESLGIDRMAFA